MSSKTNIMFPQCGRATAATLGHQGHDSHCCPHMYDESSHMAGRTKWQLAALLCMLKMDTVNDC